MACLNVTWRYFTTNLFENGQHFVFQFVILYTVRNSHYFKTLSSKHHFKTLSWCLMNPQPTFLILTYILTQGNMTILPKVCKPDHLKSYNFLKLSCTNIKDLCSSFDGYESFLEAALWETILDDSIHSGNFSVRDNLPLTWKDSITHILHGLAFYKNVRLPFALENTPDSYLVFQEALRHSVSNLLFLYRPPSFYLCPLFYTISSNIDEVFSSITPHANVLVFGDLNVHPKDWLAYSACTDRLVNSLIIFISQMT